MNVVFFPPIGRHFELSMMGRPNDSALLVCASDDFAVRGTITTRYKVWVAKDQSLVPVDEFPEFQMSDLHNYLQSSLSEFHSIDDFRQYLTNLETLTPSDGMLP